MNDTEKAILNALKQIKPEANLGDMANFLVALTQNGYNVIPVNQQTAHDSASYQTV